jgi:flavodoxin I
MKKIGIFYGSTLGNCRKVAQDIQSKFGVDHADLINVNDVSPETFSRYENLILGTSTWGMGEMQEDWENFASKLDQVDLSGKKVALFGVGDQVEWADSFVNGMGMLHHHIKDKCQVVGFTPTAGYKFEISLATQNDKFIGLAIDHVNQAGETSERIARWVEQLKKEFV